MEPTTPVAATFWNRLRTAPKEWFADNQDLLSRILDDVEAKDGPEAADNLAGLFLVAAAI